jgi:4-azaleucine resistance transporter AzlC
MTAVATIRGRSRVTADETVGSAAPSDPVAPATAAAPDPIASATAAAIRDALPVTVGIVPFGLVVGLTIRELGLPLGTGYLSSLLIFAGSAQLAVLTLVGGGAGLVAVLTTVAVVNARLLVYGALLAPSFRDQPGWFRWLAPHLLIDQTYALASARHDLSRPRRFRRYWCALGAILGTAWMVAVAVGVLVGPALPAASPLELASAALFVAMLVPRLADVPSVVVATVAGAVAAVTLPLPSGAGLPVAIVAGLVVSALLGREVA